MIKQKFSLHTHNNAFGIFDGKSSPEDMVRKAEELGLETLGISNHFIWHPNMQRVHDMFFVDYNKALDVFKRNIEIIKELRAKSKINILAGFEVDFFPSVEWRKGFERMLKELEYDYLIGSTHFMRTADESYLCNIYHMNKLPQGTTFEQIDEYMKGYWENTIEAIKSGYFDFMAHLDYCTIFNLCTSEKWNEYKWRVIEALDKNHQAYELNTSGYRRIERPHPDYWMIEELNKRNVPILISDDAHGAEHLCNGFDKAESYLESINYTNRWTFNK